MVRIKMYVRSDLHAFLFFYKTDKSRGDFTLPCGTLLRTSYRTGVMFSLVTACLWSTATKMRCTSTRKPRNRRL